MMDVYGHKQKVNGHNQRMALKRLSKFNGLISECTFLRRCPQFTLSPEHSLRRMHAESVEASALRVSGEYLIKNHLMDSLRSANAKRPRERRTDVSWMSSPWKIIKT